MPGGFSAALCRGLIEATSAPSTGASPSSGFSAALCRGLIEAHIGVSQLWGDWNGFPRLYAAASLKPLSIIAMAFRPSRFSAALCRGLIEASYPPPVDLARTHGFPRLYAAASLKQTEFSVHVLPLSLVFRGFMPRPH